MAVAEALRAEGGTAWPLHLDVGDPRASPEAVAEARELLLGVGTIDWLVNNAGIVQSAPFPRPPARDRRSISTRSNLRSTFTARAGWWKRSSPR
jgi:NAD(P)-dependent dehydrogenase (short-subunit alcohol dehydrogenase family)